MGKATVTGGTDGLYVATIQADDDKTAEMDVWCADLSEDISGTVGTIEIAGDRNKGINIQPGFEGNAVYDVARDGKLYDVPQKGGSQHQSGVYWNWAMRPGAQKWGRPTYRYGTINHVYTDEDKCDLTLDACFATDFPDGKQLSVNPDDLVIGGADIDYMDCNAKAFSDDDRVLVKFDGPLSLSNPWGNATVIGFKEEPKGCGIYAIIQFRNDVIVWNVSAEKIADDIPLNSDPEVMAIFPISRHEISGWRANDVEDIPDSDLFIKESDYRGADAVTEHTEDTEIVAGCMEAEDMCAYIVTNTTTSVGSRTNIFGTVNSIDNSSVTVKDVCLPDSMAEGCGAPGEGYDHNTKNINNTSVLTNGYKLSPQNVAGTDLSFWEKSYVVYSQVEYWELWASGAVMLCADSNATLVISSLEEYTRHTSHYFTDANDINNPQESIWECSKSTADCVGDRLTCANESSAATKIHDEFIVLYSAKYTDDNHSNLIGQLFLLSIKNADGDSEISAYVTVGMGEDVAKTDPVGLAKNNELSEMLKTLSEDGFTDQTTLELTFVEHA